MNTLGKIILLLFLFPCVSAAQETRWSQKLDDYKTRLKQKVTDSLKDVEKKHPENS